MMLIASGVFTHLNFSHQPERIVFFDESESLGFEYAGWPFHFYIENPHINSNSYEYEDLGWWNDPKSRRTALLDTCVSIVLIAFIGFVWEWLIRRREARKP